MKTNQIKYDLKISFNCSSDICLRETERRLKEELLSHVDGNIDVLKELFDEARRGDSLNSTWAKIESISKFNAFSRNPVFSSNDVSKIDVQYQWISFKQRRNLS